MENEPFWIKVKNSHRGGSGTPEFAVENRKNRWKNSLSRRFSRFFRFDFFFGGLGGVQPQSRAPRLGSSGAFFRRFLRAQKAASKGSADVLCCFSSFFAKKEAKKLSRFGDEFLVNLSPLEKGVPAAACFVAAEGGMPPPAALSPPLPRPPWWAR
ncbi:hypothetical protein, partial [Subdoligranulum variabile]